MVRSPLRGFELLTFSLRSRSNGRSGRLQRLQASLSVTWSAHDSALGVHMGCTLTKRILSFGIVKQTRRGLISHDLTMHPQKRSSIRVASPIGDENALACMITDYLRWVLGELERQYRITDMSVDPDEVIRSLDGFRPPHGVAVIAEIEGSPAGVGALRQLEPGVVEVKRMYVRPDYRDRHLGSGVLDILLIQAAATFQAKTVRLDTCRFMHSAQRLYRSRGFHERPPYAGSEIPPRVQEHWMFFEKQLVP